MFFDFELMSTVKLMQEFVFLRFVDSVIALNFPFFETELYVQTNDEIIMRFKSSLLVWVLEKTF